MVPSTKYVEEAKEQYRSLIEHAVTEMFEKFESFDKFKQRVLLILEVVAQTCSVKYVFLVISQNSQENTCARVEGCNFIKVG